MVGRGLVSVREGDLCCIDKEGEGLARQVSRLGSHVKSTAFISFIFAVFIAPLAAALFPWRDGYC